MAFVPDMSVMADSWATRGPSRQLTAVGMLVTRFSVVLVCVCVFFLNSNETIICSKLSKVSSAPLIQFTRPTGNAEIVKLTITLLGIAG